MTNSLLRPGPTRASAEDLRGQRGSRGLLAAIGEPMSYSPNLAAAGVGNALLAGQYLTGEKDIGEGMASLSDMTAMAIGSRVPAPLRKIFAGTNALNADKAKLAQAEQLEQQGADARDIWKQTGWWRGPGDKKWRFEIDDSPARLVNKPTREASWGSMQNLFEHRPLYENYPGARNVDLEFRPEMTGGQYSTRPRPSVAVGLGTAGKPYKDDKVRSIVLHELTHDVQAREGFSKGGSVEEFVKHDDLARQIFTEANQLAASGDKAGAMAKMNHLNTIVAGSKARALDQYRRLAGEAEARAVQTRRNLTPEQRAQAFPLDSYDVPLDRLVYK